MNNWQSPISTTDPHSEHRLTYRKQEAAKALGVSERTLHSLLKSRQIKSFKLGRAVLIPVAEIEAFITLGIKRGGQA